MTTARDVAERAGVSPSTVSHVLDNTRWVSPDLCQRVLSAMQDLGYEPNAVARSLKIERSNTLSLVISDIGNPFFTAVVRGVEDVAQPARISPSRPPAEAQESNGGSVSSSGRPPRPLGASGENGQSTFGRTSVFSSVAVFGRPRMSATSSSPATQVSSGLTLIRPAASRSRACWKV